MENVCLAEFVASYERISTSHQKKSLHSESVNDDDETQEVDEPVQTAINTDQRYRKRKQGHIIRSVHFNPDTDAEKFYRELIMLYHPWRDEENLKEENASHHDRYHVLKDEITKTRQTFEPFAEAVDEAARLVQELEDLDDAWDQLAPVTEHEEAQDLHDRSPPVDAGIEDYDIAQDMGLPISNVEENLHSYNEMSDKDYREHMRKLKKTQIDFVYDIIHHLKTSTEPVFKFLSGGAGVGKSFVTTALYQTALKYLNKKEGESFTARKILLLAPTGKAAYHIRGTTIHSALKIPPNQKLEPKSLSSGSLNTLRNEIGNVSLIFIDEVSMVGFKMMNCINHRLMEVKQSPKPFGGISIIAVGDLFQLKPVMDSYIFNTPGSGYLPLATTLWTELFSMVELTEIMRQSDHKDFADLLNRLREGNQTQQDIDTLKQQQLSIPQSHPDYPASSVHLYTTNDRVNAFNNIVILRSSSPKSTVTAKDRIIGSTPLTMRQKILENFKNSTQNKQLPNVVDIAEGIVYDLTVNLDTSDGLINGATCIVKKLGLPLGQTLPKGLVWVKFLDDHVGRALKNSLKHLYRHGIDKTWTLLEPLVKQLAAGHKGQAQIQRFQFPLRPAHAKTVHRSQGDTMDTAVIDLTTKRKVDHIHYVAISRLRSLEGLHVLNLAEEKISVSTDVKREMARLRSLSTGISLTTLADQPGTFKLVFLNARSLHRHLIDVKADTNLQAADMAIFCETRFCSRDTDEVTHIPSFQYHYRADCQSSDSSRPYYGMIIYTKRPINFGHQVGSKNIEVLLSKLESDMYVCAIYKSPSASTATLCKKLEKVHKTFTINDCVILGDFNVDWSVNSPQKKALEDLLCTRLGYKQVISDYSDHSLIWMSC